MRILFKTGIIEILKALLEKEKMYRGELEELTGKKGSSLNEKLNELKAQGLIEWEVEDKFQGKKWYWLTEKGRKVAEYLVKIKEVMEEG
ncbi:MAG TPA: MarR family transcriptional regulator [Thermoplasmatales archaeon]|nr:MarR family transcriptional regulator [Thermoplasmatales archaeon]